MPIPPARRPLPTRIALLSVAGLWGLYFIVLSFRSLLIYDEALALLGWRAIVTIASAGVTVLVWLVLRRVPISRLGLSILVAGLLAVPGGLAYSAINWFVFDHLGDKKAIAWAWPTKTAAPPAAPQPAAGVGGVPAPPAPPAPPEPAVSVGTMPMHFEPAPLQVIADQAGNGYFFFAAWAALYLALCYAAEVGALERRTATLAAAAQAAELRALRYQINPHFLFNTLNSLSSLVLTGKPDEADRMILNLSTFFRTSLTGDPTEDVQLSEEVTLQRLYLDIEGVRFPERLRAAIDVPDALLTACVPGLILQPLVENAVKYGVSRTTRPVSLRIGARAAGDRLVLTVADDGEATADEAAPGGTGTGLRNVRDRLAARFGDEAHVRWGPGDAGGFVVHLSMPLVHHGC